MTGLPADLRLATLVVYHFDAALKPLVRLHLERLRAHCPPETVFYGAAVRISRQDRVWLEQDMGVVLPDLPPLPPTPRAEHNLALDALAAAAFAGGASHVATFHQDSFPIHDGWLAPLLDALHGDTMFAVAEPRSYNCCMLWDRRWQDHGPAMLLSEQARASAEFARFKAAHPDLNMADGGLGHLFKAWQQGLGWRALRPSGQEVLDDTVFHLQAATRLVHARSGAMRDWPIVAVLRGLAAPLGGLVPRIARDRLKRMLRPRVKDWHAPQGADGTPAEKRGALQALLDDPDGFIAAARRLPAPEG